jgi:hypothetical protein
MTSNENHRLSILRDLLELSRPLSEISKQLSAMKWDYDGPNVELTSRHLISVMHKFQNGFLSAQDVETWADLIEVRDGISYESRNEEKITDIVFELANPILNGALDTTRAKSIVAALES